MRVQNVSLFGVTHVNRRRKGSRPPMLTSRPFGESEDTMIRLIDMERRAKKEIEPQDLSWKSTLSLGR